MDYRQHAHVKPTPNPNSTPTPHLHPHPHPHSHSHTTRTTPPIYLSQLLARIICGQQVWSCCCTVFSFSQTSISCEEDTPAGCCLLKVLIDSVCNCCIPHMFIVFMCKFSMTVLACAVSAAWSNGTDKTACDVSQIPSLYRVIHFFKGHPTSWLLNALTATVNMKRLDCYHKYEQQKLNCDHSHTWIMTPHANFLKPLTSIATRAASGTPVSWTCRCCRCCCCWLCCCNCSCCCCWVWGCPMSSQSVPDKHNNWNAQMSTQTPHCKM